MKEKKQIRTRIAPSPTGQDLHIGNAYTALINYIFAQKHKGKFIVRIEDTDRTRFIQGAEEKIFTSLSWLGIMHDEGPDVGGPFIPYKQSENLPLYREHALALVKNEKAYYCFCSSKRLARIRKQQQEKKQPTMYDGHCKTLTKKEIQKNLDNGVLYTIRMNMPDSGTTIIHDVIRGDVVFENKLIDDQVIIKSDGYPTYHLGVVVDDHRMGISHIIRGEEWISSVPKHIFLYDAFGWEKPVFAHVPLLRNPDKSKLSKRKNPVWVGDYRRDGFLPEALINYLATLAWHFPGKREVFSLQEMIQVFDLKDIQTTAPVFDREKLLWMNGEYIRKIRSSKLKTHVYDFFAPKYDKDLIEQILPLVQTRIKTLKEFDNYAEFFIKKPTQYEIPLDKKMLGFLEAALSSCEWNHDAMEKAIRDIADEQLIKPRKIFMQLRIAITGKKVGPPLLESLEILGKKETMKRLM